MAHKVGEKLYACSYCQEQYSDPVRADSCRDSHELIYIGLSRNDLSRLIQFLYLKNDDLLTDSLVRNLNKYLKGNK
jgi:hypothetical protein